MLEYDPNQFLRRLIENHYTCRPRVEVKIIFWSRSVSLSIFASRVSTPIKIHPSKM